MTDASGPPPAERHRIVARDFGRLVDGVTDWSAPSPVAQWRAADVVEHLLEWLPPFLEGGSPVRLPPPGPGRAAGSDSPPESADLPRRWAAHAAAVQAVLDDEALAATPFAHPMIPAQPLALAIDRFYTTDVFFHSWDLARSSGQDDPPALDADRCAELLAGLEPMDEMLRRSGQYGPRRPVADDAPIQERLMAFLGRDPDFG